MLLMTIVCVYLLLFLFFFLVLLQLQLNVSPQRFKKKKRPNVQQQHAGISVYSKLARLCKPPESHEGCHFQFSFLSPPLLSPQRTET